MSKELEYIRDISCLISECYSDKEPLTESQKESKQCFMNYCSNIKQSLLKSQELEKENSEYKRVLEIIKEKEVDIHLLKACITCYSDSLNAYNSEIRKVFYYHKDYQNKPLSFYLLTEEEVDLLKRYFK